MSSREWPLAKMSGAGAGSPRVRGVLGRARGSLEDESIQPGLASVVVGGPVGLEVSRGEDQAYLVFMLAVTEMCTHL